MTGQQKIRVDYVLWNINKSLAFEWIARDLDRQRFDLSFVLLNTQDSPLEQHLRGLGIPVQRIYYRGKKDMPRVLVQLLWRWVRRRPRVVHAHLFEAGLVAMAAAWLLCIRHRVFTRHNVSFHHKYQPQAVKWDKVINRLATRLCAISENARTVLVQWEGADPRKVVLLHHGFELESFLPQNVPADRLERVRQLYNPQGRGPVVGVIGRYFHLKGIHHIIPAFARLLERHPGALLILAGAYGTYEQELRAQLATLPQGSYCEIRFEQDLQALYQLFDLYVHVPVDAEAEGFGQTYVEALAAGVPSVFTLSGVAAEFIRHEKNALVVPFDQTEPIYEALERLMADPHLAARLVERGREDVFRMFPLKKMIDSLEALYTA